MATLMDRWAERYPELPNRDTFYAWRSNPRFTGSLASYLRLCACLDVDPLSIISEDVFSSSSFGDLLLMLAMSGKGGRGIKVQDVFSIFGPVPVWPASEKTLPAYNRDWSRIYFENTGGKTSHYETLEISFEKMLGPRVAHFAYRISSAERWRMYGSVGAIDDEHFLIHLYGRNQRLQKVASASIRVQTRFGEGACEFCVASLHKLKVELLGQIPNETALQFSS